MEKEIYDTYYLYNDERDLLLVSPKLENVKEFISKLKNNTSISIGNRIQITTKGNYTVTDKLWKNITHQK